MTTKELKEFLDEKVKLYNNKKFIESDPIQIPHLYTEKEDIEIAAFLTSILTWGNRKVIINNSKKLMDLMDNAPYDFIMNHAETDLSRFDNFVHRTFNNIDCVTFITGLRNIYENHAGLENIFNVNQGVATMHDSISSLRQIFFEVPHWVRTRKHLPEPKNGAACKRIHMFLRWMVRKDKNGVDFGIWENISPAKLSCPLDVHTGNIARKLGLIHRIPNDLKTVKELDAVLREFDPKDPVKYDFALFGLGVFEGF